MGSTDFVGRVSVEIDGMFCETERDFEVNMCSGECVSATVSKDGKMEKQCNCCSATKTVERAVTVMCGMEALERTPSNLSRNAAVELPSARPSQSKMFQPQFQLQLQNQPLRNKPVGGLM